MTDQTISVLEQTAASSADPGENDRQEQTRADRLVVHVANATAWLFPLLIIAINAQVFMRKAGHNQAWLDDAQWWMYGFAMTVGFAYAITTQSHVRVDVLHANFSDKKKARIEIFALGWLLLPFLAVMCDILFHYSWTSFLAREGSDSPNGLHRLYLLKLSLPILFALAMVATVSMVTRYLRKIAPVRLWTLILATLPAVWFLAERVCYYVLWWFVRFSQSDLPARQVSRQPVLEHTVWYGGALVLVMLVLGLVFSRKSARA